MKVDDLNKMKFGDRRNWRDTGRTTPGGARILLCDCCACGVTRAYSEDMIEMAQIPECGCVKSAELIRSSVVPVQVMSKDEMMSAVISKKSAKPAAAPAEAKEIDCIAPSLEVRHDNHKTINGISETTREVSEVLKYKLDGKTLVSRHKDEFDGWKSEHHCGEEPINKRGKNNAISTIRRACDGRLPTYKGYIWVYSFDAHIEKHLMERAEYYAKIARRRRWVDCLNLEIGEPRRVLGCNEARKLIEKETGQKVSVDRIQDGCRRGGITIGNFYVEYADTKKEDANEDIQLDRFLSDPVDERREEEDVSC